MTRLSFLLVGTPRSGTTLAQRLCCELPGVVMPPETHFLQLFAPGLLRRRTFPLSAAEVAAELDEFRRLPTSAALRLDTDRVLAATGPTCGSMLDLFAAVVAALCPDRPGAVYGEKTPEHLLWWRAASHRAVPWGVRDAAELAEEWALDQRQLRAAARRLGVARCLLLRYEDVVGDPDAARDRIGAFLGVPVGAPGAADGGIVQPWEWWKASALLPVTTDRSAAWRAVLDPADARAIERVAGREMAAFGYLPAPPPGRPARAPGDVRARLARRLARVRACEPLVAGVTAPARPPAVAGPGYGPGSAR